MNKGGWTKRDFHPTYTHLADQLIHTWGWDSFSRIGRDEHATVGRTLSELWNYAMKLSCILKRGNVTCCLCPSPHWWKGYFALGMFCQSKTSKLTPQPTQSPPALPSDHTSPFHLPALTTTLPIPVFPKVTRRDRLTNTPGTICHALSSEGLNLSHCNIYMLSLPTSKNSFEKNSCCMVMANEHLVSSLKRNALNFYICITGNKSIKPIAQTQL